MTGSRRSSRLSGQTSSSPHQANQSSPRAGSKRKAQDSPSQSKKGRKAQKQQTIEQSLDIEQTREGKEEKDQEMGEAEDQEPEQEGNGAEASAKEETEKRDDDAEAGAESITAEDTSKQKATEANGASKHEEVPADGKAVQKDPEREGNMPSNIIEKGIIYFLTRGRVGVDEPEGVADLQRTYFVLRPLPKDAKIGEAAMPDSNKNRLIALPKKVLPKSGKDRYMAFVEKAGVSMSDLKESFFPSSENETKTMGTRVTPAVAPIGEGVYAITTTGRASHLVYMLTIPQKLGDVQSDMGIREKGSFITSLKNPARGPPRNAQLPKGPEYPKEVIDEFGNYAWVPVTKSEYLDYDNAQILLVGEGQDKFAGAVEQTDKDKHADKETPAEELEKLEDEDQIRIEHLHGDDTVFDDLHISKKEYPNVMTTW